MKSIKKDLTIFVAVAIAFLIVSSVTAVSQINSNASKDIIRLKLEPTIDEDVDIDIEEIVAQLNIEEFIEFFASSEFINFMKTDLVKDFINSDWLSNVYNLPEVQDYISSDEFMDLYNNEATQDFLEQLENEYLIELIGMLLFWGSLILAMVLWYPTGGVLGVIIGLGLVISDIAYILQNLETTYTEWLEVSTWFFDQIFGPFDELVPLIGQIASLLSSIGAVFLTAMIVLASVIEDLFTALGIIGIAILAPFAVASVLLVAYYSLIEGDEDDDEDPLSAGNTIYVDDDSTRQSLFSRIVDGFRGSTDGSDNNLFSTILTKLFTPRTPTTDSSLINAIFSKLLNLNLR